MKTSSYRLVLCLLIALSIIHTPDIEYKGAYWRGRRDRIGFGGLPLFLQV